MDQPASQRAESTSLTPNVEPPTMEQSTIMNPRLNEQSMMVKTLIENNDSAGPDGSYFRFVVSFCAFDPLKFFPFCFFTKIL